VRQPIVQVAPVVGAGVLVEAGCLWTWYESPRLTAIYNADYTRAVLSTLPGLKGLVDDGSSSEPADMAGRLLVGLLAMVAGYVLALSCRRHVTWIAVAGAVLFRATLALMPGLYSTDVFSYVMYGRIAVGYAANPYIQPPAAFPDMRF
jgi:hypothetical protein